MKILLWLLMKKSIQLLLFFSQRIKRGNDYLARSFVKRRRDTVFIYYLFELFLRNRNGAYNESNFFIFLKITRERLVIKRLIVVIESRQFSWSYDLWKFLPGIIRDDWITTLHIWGCRDKKKKKKDDNILQIIRTLFSRLE